jgi:hypothetical protein
MSDKEPFCLPPQVRQEAFEALAEAIRSAGGSELDLLQIVRDPVRLQALARDALGLPRPVPPTLVEMIKAGRYGWANTDLNERNFRVEPKLFVADGCRVLQFDPGLNLDGILAAIKTAGCAPDPLEKLLAHGQANPEDQRQGPIYALGTLWPNPSGSLHAPYVDEQDGQRRLSLKCIVADRPWKGSDRFLVSALKTA